MRHGVEGATAFGNPTRCGVRVVKPSYAACQHLGACGRLFPCSLAARAPAPFHTLSAGAEVPCIAVHFPQARREISHQEKRARAAAVAYASDRASRYPSKDWLVRFAERGCQQASRITLTKLYRGKNSRGDDFACHIIRLAGRAKLIAGSVQSFGHLRNCLRPERLE
jgi:hypothetical protein